MAFCKYTCCKVFQEPFPKKTQPQHNLCKHGQLNAYDINVLLILPEPWISSAGRADLEHLSWFQCNLCDMLFCTYCSSWWTNIQITSWDGASKIIYVEVKTIMKTQSTFVLCEKFSWNQLTSPGYLDFYPSSFPKLPRQRGKWRRSHRICPWKKPSFHKISNGSGPDLGKNGSGEPWCDHHHNPIHSQTNDTFWGKNNFR